MSAKVAELMTLVESLTADERREVLSEFGWGLTTSLLKTTRRCRP